jgi:hypothetical protein
MYPDQTVYYVQYDSSAGTIHYWVENSPSKGASGGLTSISESAIPTTARFFALEFFDPISFTTSPDNVTKISILNKAYDVSQVVKHILAITQLTNVNILAHSMGGLDARAYVENMASAGACYNYSNNAPQYSGSCSPGAGKATYANDVANIITVDTPHAGSPLASIGLWSSIQDWNLLNLSPEMTCDAFPSTNKTELIPAANSGPGLIEALNFSGSLINGATPSSNQVPIQAVENYFSDVQNAWTTLSGLSDDIVQQSSQAITSDSQTPVSNLPYQDSGAPLINLPVSYLSTDPDVTNNSACYATGATGLNVPILHVMSCLGSLSATQIVITAQLINDSSPWISSWSVTPTSTALGNSVTVQYNASDLSIYTLSRAELWRAPDANGQPGTWAELGSKSLSGSGPISVVFTDVPSVEGVYWYGTHLFDSGGNEAVEPEKVKVTIGPKAQPPTITAFAMVPTSVALGSKVTATIAGTAGSSPLSVVALLRTSDLSGTSGWGTVAQTNVSGTSTNVTLSDTPSAVGTFLYGVHIADTNGLVGYQSSTIQVTVIGSGVVPTVSTGGSANITNGTASVGGIVNPNGSDTHGWFQYGTSSTLSGASSSSEQDLGAGDSNVAFNATLAGLTSNTTYYFRAVASNSAGTVNGAVGSFNTSSATKPTVTSFTISPLSSTLGTKLTATITAVAGSNPLSVVALLRTTDLTGTTGWNTVTSASVAGTSSSVTLYDIPPAAGGYLYGVQVADNKGVIGYQPSTIQVTVSANVQLPIVSTGGSANIANSTASVGGIVNPNGNDTHGWFQYGTSATLNGAISTSQQDLGSGTSSVAFNASLSGLTGSTTYYFRAVASNSAGSVNGAISSFTTSQSSSVLLVSTTSLLFNNETVGITSTSNLSLTNNGTVALNAPTWTITGADPGDFAVTGNNCSSGINGGGTCQLTLSFDPLVAGSRSAILTVADSNASNLVPTVVLSGTGLAAAQLPICGATTVTAIATTTANVNGVVNPNGGDTHAWFQYGTSATLNGANVTAQQDIGGGTNNIPISVPLSGLIANTKYYVRAIASNSVGTANSVISSFVTGGSSPLVVSASTLNYGNQAVNTSSTQNITLTNNGIGTLNPPALGISGNNGGDYSIVNNNCGGGINGGGSCQISISFTPSGTGIRSANLNISDSNASNSPLSVNLTGIGITQSPPTSVTGIASPIGNTTATLSGMVNPNGEDTHGWFQYGTSSTLAGATTSVLQDVGSGTTTLSITSNLTGLSSGTTYYYRTEASSIAGTGGGTIASFTTTGGTAVLLVSPNGLAFGSETVATSGVLTINLSSGGPINLNPPSPMIAGANASDFAVTNNNCQSGINVSVMCQMSVTFTPSGTGSRAATLNVTDANASNSPLSISLTGTGVAALVPDFTLSVSPASVSVVAGHSISSTVTVSPINGLSALTSFSCSGLPIGASCVFAPSTVTPSNGAPVTTTITIQAPNLADNGSPMSRTRDRIAYASFLSGSVLLIVFPWRRRRALLRTGMGCVLCFVLIGLGACGSGVTQSSYSSSSTIITITATSGGTASITHTTTLGLTVTSQ